MKRYLFFCFSVLLFYPGPLSASRIAMVARIDVTPGEDWIGVKVTVTNKGDEDALVVSPHLKLGQEEIMLSYVPRLGPHTAHHWVHRFELRTLGFKAGGSYPLFLKTHYHDVNFYPFSMPEILLLHYRVKPSDPPLKGTFDVGKVNHRGKAEVMLTNPTQSDLSGTLDLFLPSELISLTPKTEFQLPKGKNIRIPFHLENAWALPGSSYRVYAVAQLVQSNIQYTLVIPKIIEVAGYRSTGDTSLRIAGALIFLILLFAATLYFEVRKASKGDEPE